MVKSHDEAIGLGSESGFRQAGSDVGGDVTWCDRFVVSFLCSIRESNRKHGFQQGLACRRRAGVVGTKDDSKRVRRRQSRITSPIVSHLVTPQPGPESGLGRADGWDEPAAKQGKAGVKGAKIQQWGRRRQGKLSPRPDPAPADPSRNLSRPRSFPSSSPRSSSSRPVPQSLPSAFIHGIRTVPRSLPFPSSSYLNLPSCP